MAEDQSTFSRFLQTDSDGRRIAAALTKIADESYVHFLTKASTDTGGLVKMLDNYGHIPALEGNDGVPVLLYRVVEEIESIIDPSEIVASFPTLSYAQVVSALMFLRNVAQFNTRGVNIDEVTDRFVEADPDFQSGIAASMEDGDMRVVHLTK